MFSKKRWRTLEEPLSEKSIDKLVVSSSETLPRHHRDQQISLSTMATIAETLKTKSKKKKVSEMVSSDFGFLNGDEVLTGLNIAQTPSQLFQSFEELENLLVTNDFLELENFFTLNQHLADYGQTLSTQDKLESQTLVPITEQLPLTEKQKTPKTSENDSSNNCCENEIVTRKSRRCNRLMYAESMTYVSEDTKIVRLKLSKGKREKPFAVKLDGSKIQVYTEKYLKSHKHRIITPMVIPAPTETDDTIQDILPELSHTIEALDHKTTGSPSQPFVAFDQAVSTQHEVESQISQIAPITEQLPLTEKQETPKMSERDSSYFKFLNEQAVPPSLTITETGDKQHVQCNDCETEIVARKSSRCDRLMYAESMTDVSEDTKIVWLKLGRGKRETPFAELQDGSKIQVYTPRYLNLHKDRIITSMVIPAPTKIHEKVDAQQVPANTTNHENSSTDNFQSELDESMSTLLEKDANEINHSVNTQINTKNPQRFSAYIEEKNFFWKKRRRWEINTDNENRHDSSANVSIQRIQQS